MKLKTLKDLDVGFIDSWQLREESDVHPSHKQKVVDYEELKQEAIKWVKNRGIKIDSDFCEFHNITEEDLK